MVYKKAIIKYSFMKEEVRERFYGGLCDEGDELSLATLSKA
jgi:hypothetical protein